MGFVAECKWESMDLTIGIMDMLQVYKVQYMSS